MSPSRSPDARWSARLVLALGVAALAAVLEIIGVSGTLTSPAVPRGFSSTVLLAVLALVPPVIALGAALLRRPSAAAGVLCGAGALAVGQCLATVQLLAAPNSAARPELVLPNSLRLVHPTSSALLLVIGYGVLAVSGLFAALALRSRRGEDEPDLRTNRLRGRSASLGLVLVIFQLPLMAAPFTSDNLFVSATILWGAPGWELAGGLIELVAVVLSPALAALSPSRESGAGIVLGSGIGLLQLEVPRLAVGLLVPGFGLGWQVYPLMLAALAMVAIGVAGLLRGGERAAQSPDQPVVVVLPGQRRLMIAAGLLGVLTAIALALAASNPLLSVPAEFADFGGVDPGVLVPSAGLVGLLGLGLLVPGAAAVVRPAFVVACAVLPLSCAATVDGVATASMIGGVRATGWAWLLGGAVLLGLAAVCCAAVAGGVERDEVDLTERRANLPVLAIGGLGGLLAIGAFALPVLRGTGFTAPGLWSNFRVSSWGLLFALLAVLLAVAIAGFSRPVRAAALLVGAALVLGVHALELPLGLDRVRGASAGTGLWAAVAAAVVLLVCALACLALPRRAERPDPSSPS